MIPSPSQPYDIPPYYRYLCIEDDTNALCKRWHSIDVSSVVLVKSTMFDTGFFVKGWIYWCIFLFNLKPSAAHGETSNLLKRFRQNGLGCFGEFKEQTHKQADRMTDWNSIALEEGLKN